LYEDPNLGQAALRALQNHPPKRRGDDHLYQSKTQTEAGLETGVNQTRGTHRWR
jgi:hypothetical protein